MDFGMLLHFDFKVFFYRVLLAPSSTSLNILPSTINRRTEPSNACLGRENPI